jgi:ATP-dependent protease HslVU (ClpYQ) peptidase subunit
MTVIVGLVIGGKVILGADTLGSNNFTKHNFVSKKIIRKQDMLIGSSGSYKAINVIDMEFTQSKRLAAQTDLEYVYDNVRKLTTLIDASGFCTTNQTANDTKNLTNYSIIGYNGKLYLFQTDGSVLEPEHNYVTVGSGCYHAEAYMYATEDRKMKPEDRVSEAIKCASHFITTVNDKVQLEML